MNREDVIRMAREAGFETDCGPLLPESASIKVGGLYVGVQPLLERFATLVAAAEREECAKLCEEPGWNAANWCAKQIRARGEKE